MQSNLHSYPPSAHQTADRVRADSTNGAEMNPYQQQQYPPGYPQYPPPQHGQYGQQQQQQQQHPPQPQHPGQPAYAGYGQPNHFRTLPSISQNEGQDGGANKHDSSQQPGHPNPQLALPSYMPQPHFIPTPRSLQPPMMSGPQMPLPQQPQQAQPGASSERKMTSSSERNGLRYSLEIAQQPQRARMCGFGDKDRRPITPPCCVRLVIHNVATGREAEVKDIPTDAAFFVLQVDLWSEHADREANVVRASSTSPATSISTATTTSYPPPVERPHPMSGIQHGFLMATGGDGKQYWTYGLGIPNPALQQMGYGQQIAPAPIPYGQPPPPQAPVFTPTPQSSAMVQSAMYTRNLIGSLTVNASKLSDTEGKQGYWFVLQDLSVRTEGQFRLRMSFIDISNLGAAGPSKTKAPILAWTYSEPFVVFSAKKFPGVIESTPLSKAFASQGIKIPIRKDVKPEADDDDGD